MRMTYNIYIYVIYVYTYSINLYYLFCINKKYLSIYGASNLPGSSISILGFQKLVQCVARGFQVWLPKDISALQCAGGLASYNILEFLKMSMVG